MTSREALEVPDVPGTLLIVAAVTLAWNLERCMRPLGSRWWWSRPWRPY